MCSIVGVAFVWLVVRDRNGVWLDETEYLRTLHNGFIVRQGTIPFNLRWLEPVLAGPLNVFPVGDAAALKACNFASLAVACTELVGLLLQLKVARRVAIAAPVFLLCSYLGVYGAQNRLALDPLNYLFFVLILDAIVSKNHRALTGLLLVAAFNTEKVVYWIPVVTLATLVGEESPYGLVHVRRAIVVTLKVAAPTMAYLALLYLYVRGSAVDDTGPFFEQLHRLAVTPMSSHIDDPVAAITTPQMLWFPFGGLTIFALLSLGFVERRLAVVLVLLVPLVGQVLVAHDAQRMVAYCFIVYIPLASLYVTRALDDMPRSLGNVSFAVLVALPLVQTFLLPVCRLASDHGIGFVRPILHVQDAIKLGLEGFELLFLGAFVWLNLVVFSRKR